MLDLQARLANLRAKAQARQAAAATSPSASPPFAERLERLRTTRSSKPRPTAEALAASLGGQVVAAQLIEVAQSLPLPVRHGRVSIESGCALAAAARAVGRFAEPVAPEKLLFLDTETTGLAGGTGTVAFAVGLAWIGRARLHLVQWLITGFGGEGELLDRVRLRLARAGLLVTFNGKSFDVPLLKARARLAGSKLLLEGVGHLDLLHVTRRLLNAGWPDCRLRTAETEALRLQRVNDLPGAEAPAAWRSWLERGDGSLLGRVLEHNWADLLSLAALLALLERPTSREAPLLHAAA
jgi:uncharacterized protein YprB with RNaseH-like and TPR domain